MINKEKVLTAVKEMPESFDLDELVERLIFIEKVEEGIKSADRGEFTTTTKDLKEEIKTWGK